MQIRLPAEWEEQDAILLAYPHEDTDWRPILKEAQTTFDRIVTAISQDELVIIVAKEKKAVENRLKKSGAVMKNVRIYTVPTNDTWARDFGPITIYFSAVGKREKPLLLDFGFNGWGLKFPSDKDNQINRALDTLHAYRNTPMTQVGMILEGGSIESDGMGTILTTSACLLSPNRNPHLNKKKITGKLTKWLGASKVLWLDYGFLEGDDTDSHIDTLARLCPDNTILYVSSADKSDVHYKELSKMEKQLKKMTDSSGNRFKLLALPMPRIIQDEEGERLPATYANFLITNRQVLVPVYEDPADQAALDTIAQAFPKHQITPINCLSLIRQHGSLHCVTMQIPKGVIK